MTLRSVMTTGAGAMATALLGAVTLKIIALVGGPASLAIFGQLRQLLALMTTAATVNGGTSLVNGLAAHRSTDRDDFLISAIVVTVCSSALVVGVTIVLAPYIAEWAFKDAMTADAAPIRFLALIAIATTISSLASSFLNGFQRFKQLALLQLVGAAGSVATAFPALAFLADEQNALSLILLANPVTMLAAAAWAFRGAWSGVAIGRVRRLHVSSHLKMSLGMLVVGLIHIATPIIARGMYIDHWGLVVTGWFEASYILGGAYVGLFLHAAATVFLPRMSQETTAEGRTMVLTDAFRLIMVIGTVLLTLGLVSRSYLLVIFFSEAFLPAGGMIWWMLIYDVLRFVIWCCTIVLLSARDLRAYFAFEALAAGCFLLVMFVYIARTIEIGGIAYLIAGSVQLAATLLYVMLKYRIRWPARSLKIAAATGAMAAGFAIACPRTADSEPLWIVLWAVASLVAVRLLSTADDRAQVLDWSRSLFRRS